MLVVQVEVNMRAGMMATQEGLVLVMKIEGDGLVTVALIARPLLSLRGFTNPVSSSDK